MATGEPSVNQPLFNVDFLNGGKPKSGSLISPFVNVARVDFYFNFHNGFHGE